MNENRNELGAPAVSRHRLVVALMEEGGGRAYSEVLADRLIARLNERSEDIMEFYSVPGEGE